MKGSCLAGILLMVLIGALACRPSAPAPAPQPSPTPEPLPTPAPTLTLTPAPAPTSAPTLTPTPPRSTPWPQAKYETLDGQCYFGFHFKLEDLTPALANAPYGDTRPFAERMKDSIAVELGGKSPTIMWVVNLWQTEDGKFIPFSKALEQIVKVQAAAGPDVVPFLEWQACTGWGSYVKTPQYHGMTTKDIVSGSMDNYIHQYARDVKKWGNPLFIRLIGGEFNYYQWQWCSPRANPKLTPADFVDAWRRTVNIFRQEGVTNVAWVWTPVTFCGGADRDIDSYYPGDDYVDWAGGNHYDFGPPGFLDPLYDFAIAHNKPFFLAEWGVRCPGIKMTPDLQYLWLHEMFDYFESHVKVKAILYFNKNWGDVSQETPEHIAKEHVLLYGGQVNYHPNVNNCDSRLIAGSGYDLRGAFAQRIQNHRYISTLVTAKEQR